MKSRIELENTESNGRTMHEGQPLQTFNERRFSGYDHSAVAPYKHQPDQSSVNFALATARPVFSQQQKRRHRFAAAAKATLYQALYPGSFDPPTNGHLDLIQRGAKLFEHLTVAILRNPVKNPLFTVEERIEMLNEITSSLSNVSVATFDGLMVDFARQQGISAVLRGIRAISDYEYEFQMALMNRRLAPEIETVFLQPAGRYSFLSSRMVKEVFSLGGDVTGLVPLNVLKRLRGRIALKRG